MDIDAAGSDESLEDLRAYVSIVDEAEFEKGLDHFYEHHDFPESLHDAVQRMQAHRGAFPRRFDDDPVENREVPPQRVAIQRATVADPDPIVLDEPTSGLEKTARRRLLGPVIGIVIVALIGVGFLLTRGGDDSEPAPGDGGDAPALATDTTVPADENPPADDQPEDDPVDSAAPAQPDPTDVQPPATAEVTAPPAATGELTQPLFIVLSDESQYPVWALENPDGTVTYVMSSPARADGCLLISHGGNDVDTWGDCNLRQIGTSQPATVLYMGEDGSVLLHLRDPNVVNLTDEVGFAQSAIVDVLDAPVIDRQDVLTAFGTTYRSVE